VILLSWSVSRLRIKVSKHEMRMRSSTKPGCGERPNVPRNLIALTGPSHRKVISEGSCERKLASSDPGLKIPAVRNIRAGRRGNTARIAFIEEKYAVKAYSGTNIAKRSTWPK